MSFTYAEVLRPDSELGDTEIEARLTLRQVAAIALLFGNARRTGLTDLTYAAMAHDEPTAKGWAVAAGEAVARLGLLMAKASGADADQAAEFSGLLAELDQHKADWRAS